MKNSVFASYTVLAERICANWFKTMHILKESGIDWRESNVSNKLYMAERVKLRLDQVEIRSVKTGRKIKHRWCLLQKLFKLYIKYPTKGALEYLRRLQNRRTSNWPCEICK